MSLLESSATPDPSPAELVATQLIQNLRNTYNYVVASFTENAHVFWRNPTATPAEIADALGTDGRELFELHWQLGQFIAAIKPNAVAAGLNVVGEFSYTEDGQVIIAESSETPASSASNTEPL